MALDEKTRQFYELTLKTAREEIEALDRSIRDEVMRLKSRVVELEEEKEALLEIYRGACRLLGVESELEEEEFEEDEMSEREDAGGEG